MSGIGQKEMNININDAVKLLSAYDEDLNITFQVFDDTKKGNIPKHFTANLKDVEFELAELNEKGMGIFFMLNRGDGKGRSYENVTDLRCFAADLDGAPLQPVLDSPATPNFIIESSPGKYQAHWIINPLAISRFGKDRDAALAKAKEKFAAIQVGIARKFGGDASVKDLPRVLRVPGFYHNKGEPFLSRIIKNDRIQPYDAEELIDLLDINIEEIEKENKAPMPTTDQMLVNKLGPSERHDGLTKLAYKYAHQGMDRNALIWTMQGANQNLCNPPINRPGELERIIDTAIAKASKNGVKIPSLPKPPSNPPKLFTAGVWAQTPLVEPEKLVPGLFDVGDKVLIVGQSKSRKSFFTLQLAMCLAMGRKFLEFEAVEPKKVLLFQFEIKEEMFHARVARMAKKLHFDPSEPLDNLIICNARGYGNDLAELQEFILQTAKEVKPAMIILDPLYKLIEGDESKAEDVKKILKYFDFLAEATKAAVGYVHHDKKGISGDQQTIDRGAGSGVLARDADSGIYLSHHASEENVLIVDFVSRNNKPIKEFPIEWTEDGFSCSNATTTKQTSRSYKNKKVKTSEWYEIGTNLVEELRKFGNFELDMNVFNAKMKEKEMTREAIVDVKALLLSNGIIEIEAQKSERGKSNKLVRLVGLPVSAPEEEYEHSDFEEMPF